ncbi:NUDIX hydrolase [Brevibacillus sp. SYSU BS000544]|uniref:NUDIX hydrolase n=1 Tax=Brevibacillus sp. SYSU BS000544 TaxID=3416443 RepID=UPI003CE4DB4B
MQERFKLATAVHLFFIKDSQILLLRRWNTGYEDGNYSVVAGHLDGNEEVREAAVREAKEEAGVQLEIADVEVVGVMHRKSADERIDFFITVSKWDGEISNMEPDKCDDLSWHSLDSLPHNIIPYVKRAIENYRKGITFDSFGWETTEIKV